MNVRAVLFDLDGTLLDTLEDLARSGNEALEGLGFPPHPLEAYRHFVGDGVRTLVSRILPADAPTAAEIELGVARMLDAYARRWRDHTRPYAGVPTLLDGLFERGLKVAIFSNKPHDFTCMTVEALLSPWPFDEVLGASDTVPHKPDPAGALVVARRLGIVPAAFLYCGDTNTDMWTAKAAGMKACGALWGFRDEDELRASGAEILLRRPEDLLDYVGR